MTCAQPRRNATPSKNFPHTSHCTLHTSHLHFTLQTSSHLRSWELFSPHLTSSQLFSPHLTSSQLFSSHPISSHMSSKKVLLNCFHLIRALINLSHLLEVRLNSSQLFCTPESSYCQREVSCTKKRLGAETFAHWRLRRRCIYTEKPLQNSLYYKACTKHFPVLLCTAELAQSTSQYYFVLRSLHKALPSTTL